jgi:hypothetical protein
MIRDQTGWRGLEPGQRVASIWASGGQDRLDHRAVDVYRSGEPTAAATQKRPGGAYSSTLDTDFGDGPQRVE